MVVIDIHLEGVAKERFHERDQTALLREILTENVPVVLSLPPWMESYWMRENPEVIELARAIVAREGSFLGQQGMNHKCRSKHFFVDPWHENYCFWRPRLGKQAQMGFMQRGRERLQKLMGVNPVLYAPPNHMFDEDTLGVAELMGYTHFSDKAMVPIPPYKVKGMMVIPEGDLKKGEISLAAIYCHYDELDANREHYRKALRNAQPLDNLRSEVVRPDALALNRRLKHMVKISRDIAGMPKRIWEGVNG